MGSELTAMEFPGLVAVSILVCLTRGGAKDFIPSFFSIFLLADQGEALLSRFRKGPSTTKSYLSDVATAQSTPAESWYSRDGNYVKKVELGIKTGIHVEPS